MSVLIALDGRIYTREIRAIIFAAISQYYVRFAGILHSVTVSYSQEEQ